MYPSLLASTLTLLQRALAALGPLADFQQASPSCLRALTSEHSSLKCVLLSPSPPPGFAQRSPLGEACHHPHPGAPLPALFLSLALCVIWHSVCVCVCVCSLSSVSSIRTLFGSLLYPQYLEFNKYCYLLNKGREGGNERRRVGGRKERKTFCIFTYLTSSSLPDI